MAFDLIEHDGADLRRLPLIAAWGWRASCRSGRTRPIAADRRSCGSSRRTRPARRCSGSEKRNGVSPSAFNVQSKDVDHQCDAEKERRNRRGLKAENPFWVDCHVPPLGAAELGR